MKLHFCAKNENRDDLKVSALIVAAISYYLIAWILNTVVGQIIPNTPLDTLFCMGIFILILIQGGVVVLSRIKATDLVLFFGVAAFFCISMFWENNAVYITEKLPLFFLQVFPMYFLGRAVRDERQLEQVFFSVAPWIIFLCAVYYAVSIVLIGSTREDNMSFAYWMLPYTIMSAYSFLKKPSWGGGVVFTVACGIHLLTGTRGPILCILMAILSYVLLQKVRWRIKGLVLAFGGGIVYFIASPAFLDTVKSLSGLLHKFGISNRILEKIIEGELTDGSGRDAIAGKIVAAIQERPMTGYGLLGDRYLLEGMENAPYSHNLLLDLCCHFGVLLGGALMIGLIVLIVRALRRRHESRAMLLMLIATGVIKLFMSGAYLHEQMLFLLLGLCANNHFSQNDDACENCLEEGTE